jgi:hypothetical protein
VISIWCHDTTSNAQDVVTDVDLFVDVHVVLLLNHVVLSHINRQVHLITAFEFWNSVRKLLTSEVQAVGHLSGKNADI